MWAAPLSNSGSACGAAAFVCLLAMARTSVAAGCAAPRVDPVRDYADTLVGGGSIYLAIRPADLTVAKLVCLSQTLEKRYSRAGSVTAFIFSSREAAETSNPLADRSLRAMFEMGAGKSSLTIMPIGNVFPYYEASGTASIVGPSVYDTRIDLPATAPFHCRLELDQRCVMAMSPVLYPEAGVAARHKGTVVIRATVNRDGRVTSANATRADSQDDHAPDDLVRSALENVKSWQLEPSVHETRVSIAFVYRLSETPQSSVVEFDLPRQINVVAYPPGTGRRVTAAF